MLSLCLRLHTGQHFAASNLISLSRPALKRTQMELKLTNSLSKSWGCNLCRYKGPVTGAWGPGPKGPRGAHWTLAWPDRWRFGKNIPPFSHPSRWIRGKNYLRQISNVMSAHLDSRMPGRLQCLPWLIQDLPHYDTNGHRIAASAYFCAEAMLFYAFFVRDWRVKNSESVEKCGNFWLLAAAVVPWNPWKHLASLVLHLHFMSP